MNYYLPFNNFPYETGSTGILSRIFKNGINWSSILTNTQKTLNIINQTIPVIKQAGPVIKNTKTMFKIMNEFKKVDIQPVKENNKKTDNKKIQKKEIESKKTINNNPTFFQ